jgi:hypothetical protein
MFSKQEGENQPIGPLSKNNICESFSEQVVTLEETSHPLAQDKVSVTL